jgi:hypothetical protein
MTVTETGQVVIVAGFESVILPVPMVIVSVACNVNVLGVGVVKVTGVVTVAVAFVDTKTLLVPTPRMVVPLAKPGEVRRGCPTINWVAAFGLDSDVMRLLPVVVRPENEAMLEAVAFTVAAPVAPCIPVPIVTELSALTE